LEEKEITINLNQTDTKSFSSEELLQQDAKSKFSEKVKFFFGR
jgi:hypothetical protein